MRQWWIPVERPAASLQPSRLGQIQLLVLLKGGQDKVQSIPEKLLHPDVLVHQEGFGPEGEIPQEFLVAGVGVTRDDPRKLFV